MDDCISISDFSRQDICTVLDRAAEMEKMPASEKAGILANRVVATLFFEPSTRTRLSFETAAQRLGAKIIGFADPNVSSYKKGETLSDTIRMVESYADCIVMRHFIEGAPRRAAEVSKKPVINAGDGSNQHPTQTLLDLYTIRKAFGRLDNLNIGMAGDLKYGRTVHSLACALSLFPGNRICCISPPELKMPKSTLDECNGLKYVESGNLEEFLPELDVLYMTRIQKERFPDEAEYNKVKDSFVLEKRHTKMAKPEMRIMHPLPRINEIRTEVDDTPNALYFEQAANGVPARQALLDILINWKGE